MDYYGNLVTDSFLSSLAKTNAVSRVNTTQNALTPADNTAHPNTHDRKISPFDKITAALRNGNDSTTLLQKAEEGYESLTNNILLLQELTQQALAEEVTDERRAKLNDQAKALMGNMSDAVNGVQYNEAALLDPTTDALNLTLSADESSNIKVGLLDIENIFYSTGFNDIALTLPHIHISEPTKPN